MKKKGKERKEIPKEIGKKEEEKKKKKKKKPESYFIRGKSGGKTRMDFLKKKVVGVLDHYFYIFEKEGRKGEYEKGRRERERERERKRKKKRKKKKKKKKRERESKEKEGKTLTKIQKKSTSNKTHNPSKL